LKTVDSIAILDFGSQYSQLIARRVREAQVYCELFPHFTPPEEVLALNPKGFILSGGPDSVYEQDAPQLPAYVLEKGLPVLGICYGMQALTNALGGRVIAAPQREYGSVTVHTNVENPIMAVGEQQVWMSHGDRIEELAPGFEAWAYSEHSPIAAMGDVNKKLYGLQFHPEVHHTIGGAELIANFVTSICGAEAQWTPASIIQLAVDRVRIQVRDEGVIAAVSGGVDSTIAAALVHQAIGDRLTCIFVDTGLLRQDERQTVERAFQETIKTKLVTVDASSQFFKRLQGVSDPEEKRRIIGETFIRTFEAQASRHGEARFLVQGTIYPDVVESSAPDRSLAARIKTHHNVGGLPADLGFELVEPLRYLFKDEVRKVGSRLGLDESVIWRQPFPGPGLAVRCLGEIDAERIQRLRLADKIMTDELKAANLLPHGTAQAFAVLLPVQSVGVMGDQRTYAETIALRAVTTDDFMTADWARLPADLLATISNRIVNEVPGINRVVYDITSKPPATIEWE
jgi:GMP synthase (glutamine-hydrolysing)